MRIFAVDFDLTITYNKAGVFNPAEVACMMGGSRRTARMTRLFHDLRQNGVTIYVVSLNRGDIIHPFLRETGLATFVSCVYDITHVTASGSKQRLVRHLMQANAVEPAECIMVDDEPSNITNAPCWTMAVPLKHGIDDDIDQHIRSFFRIPSFGVAPRSEHS